MDQWQETGKWLLVFYKVFLSCGFFVLLPFTLLTEPIAHLQYFGNPGNVESKIINNSI